MRLVIGFVLGLRAVIATHGLVTMSVSLKEKSWKYYIWFARSSVSLVAGWTVFQAVPSGRLAGLASGAVQKQLEAMAAMSHEHVLEALGFLLSEEETGLLLEDFESAKNQFWQL